jgi:tetratricopeptide (TPR) repeat protein
MKWYVWRVFAPALVLVLLDCAKAGPRNETLYGVVALPEQKLGGMTRPVNADVAGELQWLAVQTACIGMYNSAQTGNYTVPDQAVEDYNEALRLDPNSATAYLGRGIAFASRGDFETAVADFTDAIRLDGALAAAYVFRGRAICASVVTVTEIEKGFSDFTYTREGKSLTAEQEAAFNRAIADYTQAILLDPNYALAYYARGVACLAKEMDYDQAIADFTQAIRLFPTEALGYVLRGKVYEHKGDYNRSIADYEASLRIEPNDTDVRDSLERVRRKRGY